MLVSLGNRTLDMNLTNKLDKQTLLKYYERGDFEAAKKLLNHHFSRDYKNLFNILGRVNIENVQNIPEQVKFSHYNLKIPFKVQLSKLTMGFIAVVFGVISGTFGYQYFSNGQVSTISLVMSLIGLSVTTFGMYGFLDTRAKLTLNLEGAHLNYNKKRSLKWKEVLTAYRYSDHGTPSNHRLVIFTFGSIEPQTWTISHLNRTANEIAYVFSQFLNNETKN